MLFNSISFLIFFIIVTISYYVIPYKLRWAMLLTVSCIFYMFFVPIYILILFSTIIIDYYAGILIEKSNSRKKIFLVTSIITNLGILCFFKYFNFLNSNVDYLAKTIGWNYGIENLKIVLPIGLSFHTFQAMSYTIEVYRGNQNAEKHFGIFALYVMFYPQLVAGPIERPQNIIHQLREKYDFDWNNLFCGLRQILWGMFKKVVIADRLSTFVNEVYSNPNQNHGMSALIAIFFFAFQIYCDFSGYSDIALGSARVLGIRLMTNFNMPFISRNITEFWRRWHISLSTWFNDYVFMPIATSLRNLGKYSIIIALFITFFLSGLWHGAGWNFILYGCMHGIAMIFEFITKKQRKQISKKIPNFIVTCLSILVTITYVALSWVFFRATSIYNAIDVFNACFDFTNFNFLWLNTLTKDILFDFLLGVFLILQLILLEYFIRNKELKKWFLAHFSIRFSFYTYLFLNIVILGAYRNTYEFIYFQF